METISQIINDSDSAFDKRDTKLSQKIYCALPAIVQSVNYENQTLEAKPVTIMKYSDVHGKLYDFDMPLVIDVPFQCYKGGNFAITVPVKAGDECLLIFTDVDFSAWFQNGGFNYAEHSFIHSYSNAMAIIGFSSEVKAIKDYSSSAVEIRYNPDNVQEGVVYPKISMSSTAITLQAPTINISGTNVNITGETNVGSPTTIDGYVFTEHIHSYETSKKTGGVTNP